MGQSNQEVQNYQEDEIDLRALVFSLIERKFLILGLTAFITALAALYTTTFTTTYQAKVSFSSVPSSSLVSINKLIYTNETKTSIYGNFLSSLINQDVQKDIFLENDFLTKFHKGNKPIENVDNFIENVLSSIKVIPPELNKETIGLYLIEEPYSIIMSGAYPEAISNYLDALVEEANSKTIIDIMELNQQKIVIRLDQIAIESEMLLKKSKQDRLNKIHRIMEQDSQELREIIDQRNRAKYKAKQDRLSQIAVLADSARVAKSLGIVENNFKLLYGNSSSSDLTIAIGKNLDLPEWYLYGEKALKQTIDLLESRSSDDPFIPELVTLNNQINEIQNNNLLKTLKARQDDSPFIPELIALNIEKDRLESTKINLAEDTKSINIIGPAKVTSFSDNKRVVVLLAFFGSFIISIFLALVMHALKPDGKASV